MMMVYFGPWLIGRRPNIIGTVRVTSTTTLKLLVGHKTKKQLEETPSEILRNKKRWGCIAIDSCLTRFR